MAEGLIDPTTPLFKLGPQIIASKRYCGLVNAKNRMGGYTGNSSFSVDVKRDAQGRIVATSNVQIITRDMRPPVAEAALGCLKDGYPMILPN